LNDRHNPFCPPAGRWLWARFLVENKRRLSRSRDDDRVWETVRFCRALRRCQQQELARSRLARKMPVLFEAWQLYQTSSLQRWEVEARLLACEASLDIARKCQLPGAVVEAYHDVYYCVRTRLHARDWVMNLAVGRRARQGLTEADQEILLKLYALRGGPVVLDSLVHYFRHAGTIPAAQDGQDPDGQKDLQLYRLIRMSNQLLTLPADAVHLPGLVVLLALLDRKQPAGGPAPVELIDHFLGDSDAESLMKFACAGSESAPCKVPA